MKIKKLGVLFSGIVLFFICVFFYSGTMFPGKHHNQFAANVAASEYKIASPKQAVSPTPKMNHTSSMGKKVTPSPNHALQNKKEDDAQKDSSKKNEPIEPKVVSGLVELIKVDSSFIIDLKYASSDNFTGKKIYSQSRCIIHKSTVKKLIAANNEFKKLGYRIKVFDAYRPHSAQKILWDAASDKSFVANPKKGSNHNRGAAVDITLVDLNGKELKMPSGYDEFSKRARLDYSDCPKIQITNRELLGKVMSAHGFKRISNEWWHFDDTNAKKYPVLDIPFDKFQ